jgi:hypothetical protein
MTGSSYTYLVMIVFLATLIPSLAGLRQLLVDMDAIHSRKSAEDQRSGRRPPRVYVGDAQILAFPRRAGLRGKT